MHADRVQNKTHETSHTSGWEPRYKHYQWNTTYRARYPHLTIADIRGNLNTRLRKLDDEESGKYSALVLAAAGVTRMKWTDRISQVKK